MTISLVNFVRPPLRPFTVAPKPFHLYHPQHKITSVVKTFSKNPRKSWGFSFERGKSG